MIAFVADGDQRPALAITRSLGRRGVSVVVGEDKAGSLAASSRYCAREVTYPSPLRDPGAFDRFLLDFVRRERVDVVVPVTDVSTYLVARNGEAINRYSATAAPPFEAFDAAADKWGLLQRAAACGIAIPRTHFVAGPGSLAAVLAQVQYPAVVKPVRSRIPTGAGWLPTTVRYAHSASDLLRLYQDTEYLASYPSLIQQRIAGPGMGVFVLCDRGRVAAAFAHRRLREKPPSGGTSVLCESVALDAALRDQAARLFEPLAWHGVAMMEYKQDRRTGTPFLMEVNGRFWGSLQLAIDAGVDFPYLAYRLARGEPIDAPPAYRVGVKSRWLLGDLDHLLLRLFRGQRDLPDAAPSKLRTLIDFLKFGGRGLRHEVFNRSDPRPAARELHCYVKSVCARRSLHTT
jgi:predicted ATP-grasp superfamily ATP-dependent carboligase